MFPGFGFVLREIVNVGNSRSMGKQVMQSNLASMGISGNEFFKEIVGAEFPFLLQQQDSGRGKSFGHGGDMEPRAAAVLGSQFIVSHGVAAVKDRLPFAREKSATAEILAGGNGSYVIVYLFLQRVRRIGPSRACGRNNAANQQT